MMLDLLVPPVTQIWLAMGLMEGFGILFRRLQLA